MPLNENSIPYSGYGNVGYQVFTPTNTIRTAFGLELPTRHIGAVFVSAPVQYRLVYRDGTTSDIATMPEGMTGVSPNIRGLLFLEEVTLQYFARFPEAASAITFTRRFTEVASSGQQHYTIPETTANGDFEVTVPFYNSLTGTSFEGIFGGDNTSSTQRAYSLLISNTGAILFNFGNGTSFQSVASAAGVYTANRFSLIRVTRVSNSVTIMLDGVTVASGTVSGLPVDSITRIGSYSNANYFNGIIANVNFVSGFTQTGNTAGNPTYLLDESWVNSALVVNNNASLGSELWSNPTVGSEWTDNGDGSYTLNGTGAFDQLSVNINDASKTYVLTFDYTVSGGPLSMRADASTTGVSPTSVNPGTGSAEVIINANDVAPTSIGFVRLSAGDSVTATVSNISLREAPGYGQAVNITDTDSEQFTLNQTTSPIQWENADSSTTLPVAGT